MNQSSLAVQKLQHEKILRLACPKHIPQGHRNLLVYPWFSERERGDWLSCHVVRFSLVPCPYSTDFLEVALKPFDLQGGDKYVRDFVEWYRHTVYTEIFAPFYFNPRSQRAILRLGEFKTILIKIRRLYIT